MAEVGKRLNYFNGQFLVDKDFNDEQQYQVDLDRQHSRVMHTPGIGEGLEIPVPAVGASSFIVNAGTAYDRLGQRISLAAQTDPIPFNFAAGTAVYVTIKYHEEEADLSEGTSGVTKNTRWLEKPVVETSTSQPGDPTLTLLLGVVTKDNNGVFTVNTSQRMQAGARAGDLVANSVKLSSGTVDQSHWPTFALAAPDTAGLTGDLSVTGKITVTGRVDGRDVSVDGTALDSHLANTSNPHATTAAQIDTQGGTARLIAQINASTGATINDAHVAHTSVATGAHAATAISAATHNNISSVNVQTQLQEIVTDLASQVGPGTGASLVGNDAFGTAPNNVAAGTVRSQLSSLLGLLTGNVSGLASQVGPNTGASLVGNDAFGTAPNNVAAGTVRSQLSSLLGLLTGNLGNLASQVGPNTGASLVGNDAFGTAPNNVAAGTVRSQVQGVVNLVANHVGAATAHAATAISVADAPNNLVATNVEASLTEVMSALQADHYRQIDSVANQGQHKTIRQPSMGPGVALILDSAASGAASTHFRIYADSSNVWFVINASTSGPFWQKDSTAFPAAGFRLSGTQFELVCDNTSNLTFGSFQRRFTFQIGADTNTAPNTVMEISGPVRETGRCGMSFTNTGSTTQTIWFGTTFTFRSRLPATPSTATFTSTYGGTGTPAAVDFSRDGFGFYFFNGVSTNPGMTQYWYGTYLVVM